jgi:L-arabinonolactonase
MSVGGATALFAGGGAPVALTNGVHTLDFESGNCVMLATSSDLNEMVQLADGKVDRRGRFIVGSSDRTMKEARGKLYSLGSDAALREIDNDIYLLSIQRILLVT